MSRILIVTSGPLCENPRPQKEASSLAAIGHDVTVLTVRTTSSAEAADLGLMANAMFRRETVDMAEGFATSAKTIFARRLRVWLARKAARLGWESAATLGPTNVMLDHAVRYRADLTIVHTEGPLWVGTQLIGLGRAVAADIEDWHSQDLRPEDRRGRPIRLLRSVERTLLQRAAYCSTTSDALSDALHACYGGPRPIVIGNTFPLQADPGTRNTAIPSFFWFSQTIGPGRGLEPFFQAFAAMRAPANVVLLGTLRADFRAHLLALLPPPKRAAITFLKVVPPEALPSVIARHDIGLALEQRAICNRDLTVTNKILQYLNAGLAVVATNTTGQREVLSRALGSGLLIDLNDPGAVATVLDQLAAEPKRVATMGAAARAAAENYYCWEKTAPMLLDQVTRSIAAAHAPR